MPKLFNLRTDPFERADITSNTYWDWYLSKAYLIMAAQGLVTQFLETFKESRRGRRQRASRSIKPWSVCRARWMGAEDSE